MNRQQLENSVGLAVAYKPSSWDYSTEWGTLMSVEIQTERVGYRGKTRNVAHAVIRPEPNGPGLRVTVPGKQVSHVHPSGLTAAQAVAMETAERESAERKREALRAARQAEYDDACNRLEALGFSIERSSWPGQQIAVKVLDVLDIIPED